MIFDWVVLHSERFFALSFISQKDRISSAVVKFFIQGQPWNAKMPNIAEFIITGPRVLGYEIHLQELCGDILPI